MSYVEKIVNLFGGQKGFADALQKSTSTVQYWLKKNSIPTKYHAEIISVAAKKGIELSPAEMSPISEVNTVPTIDLETYVPRATHWGELELGNKIFPCYVLDSGERVFSLKGIVKNFIGTEGGQLAEYLKVKALQAYLPSDLRPDGSGKIPVLLEFDTGGEGFTKYAQGLPVERFMDICAAYTDAIRQSLSNQNSFKLTDRQQSIALTAMSIQNACAKIGIVALVDEATGYQYDRQEDALRLKYKIFLEEEMRKWEKTFPDELWKEFGRITKWKGPVHLRPKYWGKLVNELVYSYIDPDVYRWLKENAPKPRHGTNYHQWLSSQYGLKKLTEHLWMLIGIATTCRSTEELRRKMAERFGRTPIQLTLYVPDSAEK